ncbi:MAG: CotH kinase family protein [Chloroflexales bacterium]|nr:CotH kinase family protein [Chloroflexales bacterium]
MRTNTYIFLANVRAQSDTPLPGWPSTFAAPDDAGYYPADYGMDPEVWDDPNNSSKYTAVMQALPSLSIVTDLPNLWNPTTGIYYNPSAKEPYDADPLGTKWERPISIEWINPDGTTGFEENAGMRINGQASRRPHRQPKKSFRVYFKAAYGAPKLDFKLFDHDDAVGKFDRLIIRNGGNRSWSYFDRDQRRDTDYVNDEWARRAWLQMGNLAPHGTYVHLYLNGLYWGLYNVTERVDEKFVQAYMGGTELDYGVIEADEDIDDLPSSEDPGTITAWNNLLAAVGGTAPIIDSQYLDIKNRVDVVNLADYFIHVHYIAKTDWPHHNWNGFRRINGPDQRFKFVPWDNDSGLNDPAENITLWQDIKGPDDAPSRIFTRLLTNAEFRQVVADRFYKHVLDPTGKLTPANCAALYTQLTGIIDQAVIGESARWGDYMRDVYPPTNAAPKGGPAYLHSRDLPPAYTDPANAVADDQQQTWADTRADKLANYCPRRSANLLGQYVTNSWYQTAVKPPAFSKAGGAVAASYALGLTNAPNSNAGDIYYTTDGSDPRAEFGAVATGALNGADAATVTIGQVTTVRARVLNGTTWSPLAEYTFYPPQPFENLVINEIHYHPSVPAANPPVPPLDGDDYEFVELYNRGNTPLRLDNVSFSRGTSFRFPLNTTIEARKFIVLASNPEQFKTRHSGVTPFGEYRGNLSNRGEGIALIDGVGNPIDLVDYLDLPPWPTTPDGTGPSLSLTSPTADNALSSSWRPSSQKDGTPGALNGLTELKLPTVTWANPAAITYGTPLGAAQLNATAKFNNQPLPGVFAYTPPAGAILNAGAGITLTTVFIPNDANYAAVQASALIAVQPKVLSVSVDNKAKLYGAALPALTYAVSGFIAGESEGVLDTPISLGTTATAASPTGGYPITGSGGDTNYALSFAPATLTVTPAPLTIIADDQVRNVNQDNPPLTASYSGFVNGDDVSSLDALPTITTPATPTSAPGTYPISASGAADSNYTISYVNGTLLVTNKLVPAITWVNPTAITYGTPLGAAQLNATSAVAGSFSYTPALGTMLAAGNAQALKVVFTPADGETYISVPAKVTIDVTKAPLTIRADDKTVRSGGALPTLTASYAGFVNGDDAGDLDAPVQLTTSATSTSPAGIYPIVASAAADANYEISFVNGALTIGAGAAAEYRLLLPLVGKGN